MTKQLTIPEVGTLVCIEPLDVARSVDGKTYMCRITYDEAKNEWVIASRLNPDTRRWTPLHKNRRIGLMVFLNDLPTGVYDTHLKVTAIKKSGRAVWADIISVPEEWCK